MFDVVHVYIYIYNIMSYYIVGPDCFGNYCFPFVYFFWICCPVRLPCNLQHFGAGSCHFNGIATFWSSNLIFHGICNILVLVLLRVIQGTMSFKVWVCLGVTYGALVWVYLGLV